MKIRQAKMRTTGTSFLFQQRGVFQGRSYKKLVFEQEQFRHYSTLQNHLLPLGQTKTRSYSVPYKNPLHSFYRFDLSKGDKRINTSCVRRTFYIFHQNMRVYGGGNPARNDVMGLAFNAINTSVNNTVAPNGNPVYGPCIAAGFTEIKNDEAAFVNVGAIPDLGGQFGLNCFADIFIGKTASGFNEYIGIGWNTTGPLPLLHPGLFNVTHIGSVLLYQTTDFRLEWRVSSTILQGQPFSLVNSHPLPPQPLPGIRSHWRNLVSDVRGVAFIAGTLTQLGLSCVADPNHDPIVVGQQGALARLEVGSRFIIGFVHNVYQLSDRSILMGRLPDILQKIRAEVENYNQAEVIIGGDFNAEPHLVGTVRQSPPPPNFENYNVVRGLNPRAATQDKSNPNLIKDIIPELQPLGVALKPLLYPPHDHGFVRTTLANCLDYWVVSNPNIPYANASVTYLSHKDHQQIDGLSDHSGTILIR